MWQSAALWMPEGTHWDLVFFIEENCSWSRPFLQLQPWLQVHVRSIAGSDFADVEILPQLQKQDMVWSDILFYFYSINLAREIQIRWSTLLCLESKLACYQLDWNIILSPEGIWGQSQLFCPAIPCFLEPRLCWLTDLAKS